MSRDLDSTLHGPAVMHLADRMPLPFSQLVQELERDAASITQILNNDKEIDRLAEPLANAVLVPAPEAKSDEAPTPHQPIGVYATWFEVIRHLAFEVVDIPLDFNVVEEALEGSSRLDLTEGHPVYLLREKVLDRASEMRSLKELEGEPAPDENDVPGPNDDLFITARQLLDETPVNPEWIVENVVERGGRTLLVALPKCGKSTLAFAFAAGAITGERVLGLSTSQTQVILCTEEGSTTTLRSKLERFGVADDQLHILQLHKVAGRKWPEVVQIIRDRAAQVGAGLVIIDVLHKWAGFNDKQENDSGAVSAALRELDHLTDLKVGVLILHHAPWGAARGRGSTGIEGDVDAIFVLNRSENEPEEPVRTLTYRGGRYDDVPGRIAYRLTDTGVQRLGELPVGRAVKHEQTLKVVEALGSPTTEEVAEELGVTPSGARKRLKHLADNGTIVEVKPDDPQQPVRWRTNAWLQARSQAIKGRR